MKSLLIAAITLASVASQAETICTYNTYAQPQGFSVGHIVAIETMDLSKEQNTLIVKKDGSVIKNASYADAVYANPSAKLGDVEGAVLVSIGRNQGATAGVNITMASLSNSQKMAYFQAEASSDSNSAFINNMALGLSVGCQDVRK